MKRTAVLMIIFLVFVSAFAVAEDYSLEANGEIFTEYYTRELYNALRHVLLTGESSPPMPKPEGEAEAAVGYLFQILGGWPTMQISYILSDEGTFVRYSPNYIEEYSAAVEHANSILDAIIGEKSVRSGMRDMAVYICDRCTYQAYGFVSPAEILLSEEETGVNCQSYSRAFQLLALSRGIPCVRAFSEIHSWAEVYVDGEWYLEDMMFIDEDDRPIPENTTTLWEDWWKSGETFEEVFPEAVRFAKELLVPGST